MRICFADVFLFLFCFVFFPSVKNMRQPFSGTAEQIFISGVARGGVWGVQTPSIEKVVHVVLLSN